MDDASQTGEPVDLAFMREQAVFLLADGHSRNDVLSALREAGLTDDHAKQLLGELTEEELEDTRSGIRSEQLRLGLIALGVGVVLIAITVLLVVRYAFASLDGDATGPPWVLVIVGALGLTSFKWGFTTLASRSLQNVLWKFERRRRDR